MNTNVIRRRAVLATIALSTFLAACGNLPGTAPKNTITVISSGGFASSVEALAPQFEKQSGYHVNIIHGSSMGGATDSIPARLDRQEPADMVILARKSLDKLADKGQVVQGSQVDLVRSLIGISVQKGAPKPDISTADAVKRTLLAAPSIAYSASASGTYYEKEMLKKLGIEAQVKPKSKRIVSERVGNVVARGDAAMGLQQVSELLPIKGADYVGVLPPALQHPTIFSAGITTHATNTEGAQALLKYLTSPAAVGTIREKGLEPAFQNSK
ncbi:molybdenum ABC transporter substrate-binding protein [Advenella kashmirensis W13003]|uniref:Molybdenum ABC transporter substrate-binding protein n=1 Tax=Advenella kashmirensis W13003 TaxID=1424334 RepID=V8QSR9_9BURK|nr:substrate-binding domain-containing protein [Advenella kashmirensis]ETF02677.1 molybdenum ABC transporter substrate-binding protein [Advenella kashmirensis W13003]